MTMRDTPSPSCRATENLPVEFADGAIGLPAMTLGAGTLDAGGATGAMGATGAIGAIGATGATGAMGACALGATDLPASAVCGVGAKFGVVYVPDVSTSFAAAVVRVARSASITI